jgi:hypothetical protein
MGGRIPKKVYVYNDKGEFVNEFESSAEFAKNYNLTQNFMSIGNYNFLDLDINFVSKNTFVSYKKVGKSKIINFRKKINSPFVRKKKPEKKEQVIDVFNLNGELIASFRDDFYLKAFLGKKLISKTKHFFNTDLRFEIGV